MNKNYMLYSATMACLAQFANAAIVADGIWTGNDWYDEVH
jgi:chitodextrinase